MAPTNQIGRKIVFTLVALALAAVGPAGCGSREATTPPSAGAVVAAFSKSGPTGESGGDSANSTGATQRSSGGSVTIDVTWDNPKETTAPLSFSVAMNTHSVDLDGYDFGKLAVLRNDRGQEVRPQLWEAPSGGHHRSGVLIFPATDGSGKPMAGTGTKTMELVIRDVAGVKERVLRWQVSS